MPSATPHAITPVNYRLSIFDIKFAPEWQFAGSVIIESHLAQPVTEIVLHAVALEISHVEFVIPSENATVACTSINASYGSDGVTHLQTSETLKAGDVHIKIQYRAFIGKSMVGFFRANYRAFGQPASVIRDGDKAVMLATHFEPCHARWAFPCIDEPHLKATFDLSIEIPEELTALSNMPVKDTTKLSGGKDGLQRVAFHRTPVMSTYLLAWAVGEFEYVEALTEELHGGERIPVRVYTPIGLTKHATLALDCAWRVLDMFKRLFKIDYPIPKSDHLVVPEFVSGAMENWGLITYKPTKILFDPETSNNRVMSKAAYVVAHELAHQWFGNLVTMNSWTELWLNEGFATWAGYLAVDNLHPEWDIWSQYVTEIVDEVLKLDSLPTTRAILAPVADENDAMQMFDQISYSKASSIIRMLAAEIGESVFLQGLSQYLSKHAYANASSQDLWDSMSEASGTDVSALMDSWINTPGFPVLQFAVNDNRACITQRGLPPPKAASQGGWQMPKGLLRYEAHKRQGNTPDQGIWNLNQGHVGYFCVNYSPGMIQSVVQSLPSLAPVDVAGIIVDLGTLVLNNMKPTSELLDFIWALRDSREGFVWISIARYISSLRSLFSEDVDLAMALKLLTADLIGRVQSEVDWTSAEIPYTQAELNKTIVGLAFSSSSDTKGNCTPTIERVKSCFGRWAAGETNALHPSMRGVILSNCISQGSRTEFDAVMSAFKNDTSLDGQEILLTAMGATQDSKLAEELLQYAFLSSENVPLQHLHLLGGVLGQNSACRRIQWNFVKRNWTNVASRLDANPICRDWWMEESLRHFSDLDMAEDIGSFLTCNASKEVTKPLEYVKANISRNANYKKLARSDIRQWLDSRGYISG